MADPLSAAEVQTLLDGALAHIAGRDFDGAYNTLAAPFEAGAFTGTSYGAAAVLLAEACIELDALDAAVGYLDLATQHGDATARSRAEVLRTVIGRYDAGTDAAYEGVDGSTEAEAVLTAAEQALRRNDYDDASEWFTQVYQGAHTSGEQLSRASVGLAAVCIHFGRHDDAAGYLDIAEMRSTAGVADRIAELRTQIQQLAAGESAAEGGTDFREIDEVSRAANVALEAYDNVRGRDLLLSLLASDRLATIERGRVSFNLGAVSYRLGEMDAAKEYLEQAAQLARPEIADEARKVLDWIATMHDADEIAANFRPIIE